MEQITTADFQLPGKTVITLGKFDGLHRGHQKLLHAMRPYREAGLDAVVFTFSVSPAVLVQGAGVSRLMTGEEKRAALAAEGIDYLISYPCDRKLIETSAEDFIEQILVGKCHAAVIVVGTDCRFGYQRRGDCRMLQELAQTYGYEVVIIEKEIDPDSGREISSSYIKEELQQGNIEHANAMLGYPYSYTGEVAHGRKLGRTIGIPTMNLYPEEEKAVPPVGVYCVRVDLEGKLYEGIANIGYKPTVTEEHRLSLETFLFHFCEEVYGKTIMVMLYSFVRAEKRFQGLKELQEQIQLDVRSGEEFFTRLTENIE